MSGKLSRKVAFVGTSCIGKTSLLEVYKQRFKGDTRAAFIDEAARAFFASNSVDDRFSAESQGKIQAMTLANEKAAHESGASIIMCDRAVIDAVVYTQAHGDSEGARALLKRVESWIPTYKTFLLLDPADVPYATDEVRDEDVAKRQQFHDAFLAFFDQTGIPYELLSGTLRSRVKRVDEIMNL